MKGGLVLLEATIPVSTVLRYGLITLGLFALIYLIAVLTPKMAKYVDAWIAKYRAHHDPKQNRSYGVRSIYELPPENEEQEPETQKTSERNQDYGEQ